MKRLKDKLSFLIILTVVATITYRRIYFYFIRRKNVCIWCHIISTSDPIWWSKDEIFLFRMILSSPWTIYPPEFCPQGIHQTTLSEISHRLVYKNSNEDKKHHLFQFLELCLMDKLNLWSLDVIIFWWYLIQ